ncbi:amidase signature enzyme [Metschnikowia bicuspidata var. bicuspidata NRRL YB-4993]|uniref:Glutamyl-tRNA(Gln) amidotransferase subunit A, mitochondrial n=1 Tax=Metschnikowia bicuspidata var. bicuspidata NRRL YB-4993 TaxID=869754 RepID=A0A1A0H5P5_9ASCO|nr:amidase signature enzyme [Metschnikowia bicuspidata var. bicuspidata NRRL YB-4993]OBA19356.1 amidase signature enzyme [Metschnikowia bicuspidata var. bicuspidata NRRL YB-4993]
MIRPSLRRLNEFALDNFNCLVSRRRFRRSLPLSGPLGNTTFAAKDNISTTQEPTTCGSKILETYVSPFQATVITQLEKAGLVLVGKANMDEFGMGSSTTHSSHGPTINPRFTENRICGGSSGGSAAAVAGRIADFALGTDTGGSVRQPASYCGIVGFKPSYGRISRYGVVAYGQGLDCVGILSNNVKTASKVYSVLDEYDEKDITSMPVSTREAVFKNHNENDMSRKLKIGIPQEFILDELHPETRAMLGSVLEDLMDAGHAVYPVSIPSIGKLLSAYYTLATVEAASNLSRFDGLRYGSGARDNDKRADGDTNGQSLIARQRTKYLGPEVQRRIILGNYTLSSEAGDNYLRATQHRSKIVEELNQIFELPNLLWGPSAVSRGTCDVLIGPTAFGKAPTFAEYELQRRDTFLNEYLNDVFTVPASMAGLPAISVPYGKGDCGVQVMGQYGDDETVLRAAELIERL